MRFFTKLKLMPLTVYFSLIIVLVLTACGGDNTEDANETSDNETVTTETPILDQTEEVPTVPPISQTLPPSNPTLPPAATSEGVVETIANESGTLRVVNAITDVSQVDIFVGGEAIERRLETYSASGRGTELPSGTYELSVVESTGVGLESSALVYFEGTFDVQVDDVLLLVLTGTSDAISLSVFHEDISPIEPGHARMMFVNAIQDVSGAQLSETGSVLIDAIPFNSISAPIEISARDHDFNIEESDGGFLTSFERELESGFEYIVVLVGDLSSDTITFVILERETPPQTRVRLTHAAPDMLAIDVLFGDVVFAEGLNFGETIDFQTLPSQFYDIRVYDSASGTSSTSLLENRFNLREHQSLEMVIYGQDNDLRIASYTVDTSPIPVGFSRLVVFHAAIGEGGIRFIGPNDSEIGLSAQYGEFSGELLIDIGATEFRFGTGSEEDPDLVEAPSNPINLEEGTIYTYIVTGRTDEEPLFLTYDVRLISQSEEGNLDGGGTRVSVRVINALTNNEAIRLEIDDIQVTTRLQQYLISSPTSIESGFHVLRLYNASDILLYELEVTLEDYQSFTVFVLGEVSNTIVVIQPDFEVSSSNEVVVRYIHAAPDLPRVVAKYRPLAGGENLDPGVATPTDDENQVDLDDYDQELSYTDVSQIIEITAGISQFTLVNRETLQDIVSFNPIDLVGGRLYELLLVPSENDGVELQVIDRR